MIEGNTSRGFLLDDGVLELCPQTPWPAGFIVTHACIQLALALFSI